MRLAFLPALALLVSAAPAVAAEGDLCVTAVSVCVPDPRDIPPHFPPHLEDCFYYEPPLHYVGPSLDCLGIRFP